MIGFAHLLTVEEQASRTGQLSRTQSWRSKSDMKHGVITTLYSALSGAIGAALLLVIVLAVSSIVLQRQSSGVRAQVHEKSAIKDLKPTAVEMIEEGKDETDEDIEGAKTLTDWEAAHAAAESGNLTELRQLILERGVHVDAEDRYSMNTSPGSLSTRTSRNCPFPH